MPISRNIEIGLVILFEVVFAFLAIQALLIQDIPRFYNVLLAMFIAVLPILTEKIMDISLPFGVKILVPFCPLPSSSGRHHAVVLDLYAVL